LPASRSARREKNSGPESDFGPEGEERHGVDWRKVMAAFVIFLLIGSVVVFFVLYALSLL
jgi:hypothetical protein